MAPANSVVSGADMGEWPGPAKGPSPETASLVLQCPVAMTKKSLGVLGVCGRDDLGVGFDAGDGLLRESDLFSGERVARGKRSAVG